MSLSQTRRIIGKNTKFKKNESKTSNTLRISLLVSFTIAIVVLPVIGTRSSSSTLSSKDKLVVTVNLDSKLENFRFAEEGARAPFSFERLNTSTLNGDHAAAAVGQVKISQRKANHHVKKYVKRYKRLVEQVHPHLEERNEHAAGDRLWSAKKRNGSSSSHSAAQQRSKRAVIFQDANSNLARARRKIVNHESEGTFVIKTLNRASPQFYDTRTAIDINSQSIKDKTFVFAIETAEEEREVKVYQLNEKNLEQRLLFHEKAPDAVSVDVVQMKGDLYAFTTVNHEPQVAGSTETINTGSTLYRFILSNSTLDKTQTIHLPFAKSSAFWTGMGEEANEIFLALAPEKTVAAAGKTSYSVFVPLYRWQGGYFDYVSQLPASNPQSVQHFSMFSHDYLAVANYQDDTGSTSVQSEIFKYHHKESRFASFQRVQTFGAKDIRHFTFSNADERRQEHFIAIANNCKRDENGQPQFWVQSTIMKFGSTRFLPFKSFYSYGANQFLPVKDGSKFFLAFTDFHGIRLLQYNGWTFVQTFSKQFEAQQLQQSSRFSIRLRPFNAASNDGKTYFTVATPTTGLVENGMFGVAFETRNDHRKLVTSVEAWCNAANQQMRGKNLILLENGLNSAPKENDTRLMLNGKLEFVNGVKIGDLKSRALKLGRGRSLDHNKFKELSTIEGDFNTMVKTMTLFHSEIVNNVVWTNRKQQQEINSIVHFRENVMYANQELDIKQLKLTDSMGSIAVAHHLDNLIFLNQPHELGNVVTDAVIANDATLTTLNGRLLSDYALRQPSSTKQIFTGNNEFLSGVQVTKAIQTDGDFAGLSFAFPQFLLYRGNQSFAGTTMQLTDSKVTNLYTRILNGVDLFNMYKDAVSLSGGTISADKTFVNGGVKMQKVAVGNINGVDIESLYKNAIYTTFSTTASGAQTFTQPVHFENLEVESITPADANINGQFDVNLNFHKLDGQEYNVKNMKLTSSSSIDKLFVKNKLNNVNVLEDTDNLDLFLRHSTEVQHVKSKWLKSIHFTQNVEATQLVDNVDLAGWSHEQEITLADNKVQGILNVPGHVQFDGGLLVKQEDSSFSSFKQNNFDVTHVLQNSARTDAEKLPGSCSLHFDNLKVLGNSDIRGKVNSVFPHQWVINSEESTQLEITAAKEFTGPVHIVKDVGANALFGKAAVGSQENENLLQVFPTLLLNGTDQTITNEMTFGGKFRVDQASCPNAVLDKVPFDNVLFKKGDQTVEVETTFNQPFKALGDVTVTGDVVTALVNGIDINEQLKNTLRTNGDQLGVQRVTADNWQFSTLTVTDKTEINGALASTDVNSLYGDIIRKDGQTIELDGVNLSFEQGAIMSRVEFIGSINKIPSTEWGHAWLLTQTNQVVETMVEFGQAVTAEMLEAPSVNGVDIRQLSKDIVRIDQDETLEDDTLLLNFKSPVTTQSGVAMPNGINVNGVDLSKDVLLKNSAQPQTVTGKNTFQKGVTIKGNLNVKEMPGFDIANFARLINPAPESLPSSSSSLRIKGNLDLETEPDVTFSVNNNNWDEMLNELWFKDKKVDLKSPVKFGRVVLQKGGTMEQGAQLNGIDLKNLESNYASKTRNQKWLGEVTLGNVKKIEQLTSASLNLENDGKFNNVNLADFYNSVLRYTEDQEIKAEQLNADNLIVTRLGGDDESVNINSVDVKSLMTVSGENVVHSPKQLKLVQGKNVVLSKDTIINGVNMGEWDAGAVKKTGKYDIAGPVEFKSLETTENVIVEGFVDDVKYNLDQLVTTDQDQVIHNRVEIKQRKSKPQKFKAKQTVVDALAGIEFKGKVNDINVQDSISKMVFKNENVNEENLEPIIIRGEMVFNAPVVLNRVTTEALIQGQNITAVMDTMTRAHDQVHSNGFKANEQYSKLLSMTKRMLEVSKKRAVFLDYFVLTQTIKVAASYVKVLRQVGYPAIAIGFKKSELITTENWWSYSTVLDYYQLQIGNRVQLEGRVTDVAELSHDSSNLFAFAVNNDANEKPAQAHLDILTTNNVQSFEINKTPDKLSKTFILKTVDVGSARMRQAISQVIYSHEFKSVHSFTVPRQGKDGGVSGLASCLAATTKVANEVDSAVKIFCMDSTSDALETVQEIHLDSPSLITSTTTSVPDATLLAILTRSAQGQPEGLLEIWSYSHRKRSKLQGNSAIQFVKQNCLPVFNAIGLDSLSTENGKSFLTVASGAVPGTEYQGSVFVYRYSLETHQFKKVQTLEVSHPVDVKLQWLKPSNEVVLYVLSQSITNNVQVYKRQGLSGWSMVHQFTSENGKSLEVADFTVDGIYRAQLLVTSPTQTNIYAAEFMGVNSIVEEEYLEFSQQSDSLALREFIDFDNL